MLNASKETLYHAIFLAQHLRRGDLKDVLVYILSELRLPNHLIGYYYVHSGILIFCKDPVRTLLAGIYQAINESIDPAVSYHQMESAMRNVIDKAYDNCDPQVWNFYFLPKKNRRAKRPSNLEFITEIARFMELWQGCCKEASYEL